MPGSSWMYPWETARSAVLSSMELPYFPFAPTSPVIMAPGVGLHAWEDFVFEYVLIVCHKVTTPSNIFYSLHSISLKVPSFHSSDSSDLTCVISPFGGFGLLVCGCLGIICFALFLTFSSLMAVSVPACDMFLRPSLFLIIKSWRSRIWSLKMTESPLSRVLVVAKGYLTMAFADFYLRFFPPNPTHW